MLITSIFIIIAIGILAFAVITSPLYDVIGHESTAEEPHLQESAQLIYQRDRDWLHDLEIEFAAGKIDQVDYTRQRNKLQAEAERYSLQFAGRPAFAGGNEVEGLISNRRMARVERSAGFCVKCGAPLTQSDVFCPTCGMKLN